MHTNADLDAWSQMLEWLMRLSTPNKDELTRTNRPCGYAERGDRVAAQHLPSFGARVSILERPEAGVATISWYDPVVCHYGEQTWRATIAKHGGVCAVSGANVRRGAAIYSPGLTRPRPLNAHAMILAQYIESATGRALLKT